jgi:hypothetical protein
MPVGHRLSVSWMMSGELAAVVRRTESLTSFWCETTKLQGCW